MEEVDHLIEALNPRGHREGGLKEALLQERDRLQLLMQNCNQNKYSHTGNAQVDPRRQSHTGGFMQAKSAAVTYYYIFNF